MGFQKTLASLLSASLLVATPGPGVYQALAQQAPMQVQTGQIGQAIPGFAGPRIGVSAVPGDLGRMTLSPATALPSLPVAAFRAARGPSREVRAFEDRGPAWPRHPRFKRPARRHQHPHRFKGLRPRAAGLSRRPRQRRSKCRSGNRKNREERDSPMAWAGRQRESRTLLQSLGLPSLISQAWGRLKPNPTRR